MSDTVENDLDPELSLITGEFRDPATEKRFRAEQRAENFRQAQFLFAMGAGISALLLALNLLLPVSAITMQDVIPPRLAVILTSLASLLLLGQMKSKLFKLLLAVWVAVIAVSSAVLVEVQMHLSIIPVLFLPAIFFLALPTHFLTTVIMGIACTIVMLAAYAASGPDPEMVIRVVAAAALLSVLLIAMRSRTGRKLRTVWAEALAHKRALAELAENRHIMERLFKAVPVPLVITGLGDGKILRANEAAEKFLQVPEGKLVGQRITDYYKNPSIRSRMARDIISMRHFREAQLELVRSDGEVRTALVSASVMEGENDHEGTIIAGVMDITDQRHQERQIRAAESEYRNLFENAVVGIYRSRPDGTMQRANPALVRFNGYETEDELIAAVNDISDEWYVNPIRRAEWLRQMHQNGRVTDFVSEVYRHKTREKVWISENSWTVYDSDGAPAYYEGTVVEATDRKRLEKKIEHMALHDQLTNLANRRLLTDRLEQACLRVQRYGGYFSVMCLDLDQFKAVNDAFGHSTGDLLLQKVAKRLRAAYRAEDTVARTGGDEFIVLTVGIGNPARLTLVAERVVNSFEKPFMLNGRPLSIGISIGIAVAPIDSLDPKELLAKADQALYRAKKDGRNQYRFFNESIIAQGKNKLLLLEKNRA